MGRHLRGIDDLWEVDYPYHGLFKNRDKDICNEPFRIIGKVKFKGRFKYELEDDEQDGFNVEFKDGTINMYFRSALDYLREQHGFDIKWEDF